MTESIPITSIRNFQEELDCIICMMENRIYTEESEICLHWNKICRDCKQRLYEMERNHCPYCQKCWTQLFNKEFKEEVSIKLLIQSLSEDFDVFTDEEATEHCKFALSERLHELEYDEIKNHFKEGCILPKEIYEKFVERMEEDSNPILEQLLNCESLCQHLISTKGRGYIIAMDEIEIPIKIFNKSFFAYAKEN